VNRWRAHLFIYPTWLSSWLLIMLTVGLVPQPAYRWTGMHTGAVPAAAKPPTCIGSHDFLVDQGRVPLQGVQTFDRLCILDLSRQMVAPVSRSGWPAGERHPSDVVEPRDRLPLPPAILSYPAP
jgi:hypothetical protein